VHTDIPSSNLAIAGYEQGDFAHVTIGTFDGALPFVAAYTDVPRGNPLIRINNDNIEVSISYGNFSEKYAVPREDSVEVVIRMAKKGGYAADLEIMRLTKSNERADYASDAVFANYRQVQLGSIPAAFLYRSCHPALGDARAPYAARLAEDAKIATIINLADTVPEVTAMVQMPMFPQTNTAADSVPEVTVMPPNVPWYAGRILHGSVVGLAMGVDFASSEFHAKLRDGLLFMLSHDGPYLIHCNEGKDRTGYVAALLEALMGATVNQVIDDYMVTYVNYFGFTKDEPRYKIISQVMVDILTEMNGGKPVTDRNIQKAAENCLTTQIGLTKAEVSALKKKLSGK
jgi:hypothetical protein